MQEENSSEPEETKVPKTETEEKEVPISELGFNISNVNVQDEKVFENLKHSLKLYGNVQFPTVLEVPEEMRDRLDWLRDKKYLVMDGHHRILALEAEGERTVRVTVAKNIPFIKAFVAVLNFNKSRGKVDAKKVANLLIKASELYDDVDALCRDVHMPRVYFDEYTAMLRTEGAILSEETKRMERIDENISGMRDLQSREIETMTTPFIVNLSTQEREIVENVLNKFTNQKDGLIKVCKFYAEKGQEELKKESENFMDS